MCEYACVCCFVCVLVHASSKVMHVCGILWLQFAPSFYHHEPSIFNYIRYCLKWMFLFHLPSHPHISLIHSLTHSLSTLPHNHMLQFYWERKICICTPRCTTQCIVSSAANHQCSKCIYAMISFDTFIGCSCSCVYILHWIRIFFRIVCSFFLCLWSLIFSFCFSWFSFCVHFVMIFFLVLLLLLLTATQMVPSNPMPAK